MVYTALDQLYSEPILQLFEQRTGVRVRAVYDSEAAKTVGLVNRLIAERGRPRCDVFWNNEIIRTIRLKKEGLLDSYVSPHAEGIPESFKDSAGFWTGFAGRARVLAFNTKLATKEQAPRDVADLVNPVWKGKIAMAYPLFGSTSTHAAVLFSLWGVEGSKSFFLALKANDVRIMDGNMTVCRAVASGEIPFGLTDTDDAHLLRSQGNPIDWILLDHRGAGALLIPNTVCLVKGCPHPGAGKKLIDFLVSEEVEGLLAGCESAQIPLHASAHAPAEVAAMKAVQFLPVNFADAESNLQTSADYLQTLFAKP